MKIDRRYVAAVAVLAVAMASWMGVTVALLWSTLSASERDAITAKAGEGVPVIVMTSLVVLALAAAGLLRLQRHFIDAPARLAEQARVALSTGVDRELEAGGSAETRALAQTINALVYERSRLRADVDEKVAEASRDIDAERARLAALMSELNQSVVVCNLDGRIILYNHSALVQFRAISQTPQLAGGAELIGLGRSIYVVFDPKVVAHALENIRHRMQRGARVPTAQFVTATQTGQLLRVQMAPVRGAAMPDDAAAITGFVLMLDNITHDFEAESSRDRLLHGLTEGGRASLGNLQAAVEMLDYPDLDTAMRERFHGVIRDEVRAMSERIQTLANTAAEGLKTRWPLEDMLGADVVSAATRRIADVCKLNASAADVDESLWLKVDSFSLLQALTSLACRLSDEFEVRAVDISLSSAGSQRAYLDLIWSGHAMSTETVMSWEIDPMTVGDERLSLTVRDVVERHGGEFWFERDRPRQRAFFRFLLPLAPAPDDADAASFVPGDSRPEYYDFDLFKTSEHSRALDDRPLAELSYTVFDTETTGLAPSQGDEIIQLGAVRIVNGRLLKNEGFEQLVDPGRTIPEQSIAIHGISPDMVKGQPTIDAVLPAFHAFAHETVLVAHNAAFDMRFLQLKEARTGVRFEQPVLDTLLLSAALHPNQESHALEAIAERLGIAVTSRHTALGDAMLTADVFLKLVALLEETGIHTLGQARTAAERTYHARLRY